MWMHGTWKSYYGKRETGQELTVIASRMRVRGGETYDTGLLLFVINLTEKIRLANLQFLSFYLDF